MEQASLHPGIGIQTQGVVVLPIYVEPSWDLQDSGSTVRLACVTARLIFDWIPGVCDFTAFWVERYLHVIAFIRHEHAVTPHFSDDRYPISREIVRSCGARCSSTRSLPIGWTLRGKIRWKQQR